MNSRILLPLVLLAALALPAHAERESHSAGKWSKETLDQFSSMPILDGGRVKPLDTYASFKLLRINGKRTYTVDEEARTRISALEWLLDCLYHPETTKDYKHFGVDNSEVITMIGAQAKDLRDRYSYNEILPGYQHLFELAQQYSGIEDKNRTPIQRMVLNLATNVREYEFLIHYFDFARESIPLGDSALLQRTFGDVETVTFSQLLAQRPELVKVAQAIAALREQEGTPEDKARFAAEEEQVVAFFGHLQDAEDRAVIAMTLALIPPSDPAKEDWYTPASLLEASANLPAPLEKEIQHLAALEKTAQHADNALAFHEDAKTLSAIAVSAAKLRGEYGKIPIELQFYKGKFFFYAQWLFVLSFVLVALSWLFTRSALLYKGVAAAILAPWTLLVVGITYRCIIRSRPPISTLYETILFITAAVVLVALIMEYINRQRIALAMASVLGTLGMFLAYKYEMMDKQDTMPSLVAVLDTNFWLSTHVTTVTTGYAAGLLAGAIGCVYILSRLFNFKAGNKDYYKTLTRMIYGIICFGMIFSFVGTVLGGIWANYSWGRFWGWDPKENGALLIVLWNLSILHARMGGYIRDLGIAMAAVAGGMVVAFSWWGVNLLGVGLHSYGFTSGIWGALMIFWATQGAMLLVGVTVFMRERLRRHTELTTLEPVAK